MVAVGYMIEIVFGALGIIRSVGNKQEFDRAPARMPGKPMQALRLGRGTYLPMASTASPMGKTMMGQDGRIARSDLTPLQRRLLSAIICGALAGLVVIVAIGWRLERNEHSALVKVGEPAPDFTLTASTGGAVSLVGQRGHPLLLAFLPSVQCGDCQHRLRALRDALPELTREEVGVYAISTDEPEAQRTVAHSLHLGYPLLAEDVIVHRHPAGRAYGVFHETGSQQGPVDAAALVLIDTGGVVRAVDNQPAGALSAADLVRFVSAGLASAGGGR